ncbi:MAG: hypothetical protein SOI13_01445 [Bifidobacterium mongoliense]|jgi:hypothetical protein|uniref:hypothetical protein n=1 Tax=Bifidobacterium mongoliense TaxID=518643 RepID=UPI002F3550CA
MTTTSDGTGIRYVKASKGYEVYAIPSHPYFADRRSALQALYEYQHNGMQFPSVYELITKKFATDTKEAA